MRYTSAADIWSAPLSTNPYRGLRLRSGRRRGDPNIGKILGWTEADGRKCLGQVWDEANPSMNPFTTSRIRRDLAVGRLYWVAVARPAYPGECRIAWQSGRDGALNIASGQFNAAGQRCHPDGSRCYGARASCHGQERGA